MGTVPSVTRQHIWDPAGSSEWTLPIGVQIHPVLFSCSADPYETGAPISETLGGREKGGQGPSCLLPEVSSSGSISAVVCSPPPRWNLRSPTRQPLSVGNPTCSCCPPAPHLHPLYPSRRSPSSPNQVTYIKSITSQISQM